MILNVHYVKFMQHKLFQIIYLLSGMRKKNHDFYASSSL